MPSDAELGDRVGRGAEVAAGDDEVGLEADDLLDVDAVERRDDRERARLGREVRDVLDLGDDAVARAEREQDLGRGRGQRHDLLRFGGDRRRPCPRRRSGSTGNAGAGRRAPGSASAVAAA